jgi:hypothetical protein
LSVSGGWVSDVRNIPRVDCGYSSFLPICPACSWRGLPRASRDAAAVAADRHAVSVHADPVARAAADARRRRQLAGAA